jgi:hypothetical protein
MKLTRQGVRDLNTIPGKSAGRKLPMPPSQDRTHYRHPTIKTLYNSKLENGHLIMGGSNEGDLSMCEECGHIW